MVEPGAKKLHEPSDLVISTTLPEPFGLSKNLESIFRYFCSLQSISVYNTEEKALMLFDTRGSLKLLKRQTLLRLFTFLIDVISIKKVSPSELREYSFHC